ncbi:hypothetical protein GQ457_14G025330 [Hibiscus cannabinus]
MASSSSSGHVKHQVFLSFRGEDTRLNFTSHLRKALKDAGMSVFFDEDALERGEEISPALSRAIEASRLSIVVLSSDYASSKSCLAELSDIMHRWETQGHIVLPIFYHVDPSHVRNLGGTFKKSFDDHESKRLHQVQRWKTAFAQVGKLKGWHIEGGKFDKHESDYIKEIVGYVIKKVSSSQSETVSRDYVGIDNQKEAILNLIKKVDSRVVGLWGMGGIGKTTLADVVYKEVSTNFEGCCFLQNVREEIENQGKKSLRNELLSALLEQKDIRIDGPSIGSPYRERLNNKRVIVVLDDVNDSEQVEWMGVEHFGEGSKIIITSRDIQVLKNARAGDNIHEVEKLDKSDSLQLFSTSAFQQLNPTVDFLDLSYKFVAYADGIPLALKVLGSKLFSKPRKVWESEVDKLKQYPEPKFSHILKSSFNDLDEVQQNIFLDVACFFKGKCFLDFVSMNDIEEILCYSYKGAVSGLRSLHDKCLLDINPDGQISMHDMIEEMAKEIVCKESNHLGERSRLWKPVDVYKVLKNNKGTDLIQGITLDLSQIDIVQLHPSAFENMYNLRYIKFYTSSSYFARNAKSYVGVDIVSLPDELRLLWWTNYPYKSLSSSFNPKNLVVLKLEVGDMEQLWNEDDYQDLPNLKVLKVSYSFKLKKIPNLSGAINLKSIHCVNCRSLVELPCLSNLTYLEKVDVQECYNLKKFPELPNNITDLDISYTKIEEVSDSIEHLVNLKRLNFKNCPIVKIPRLPRSVEYLDLSGTQVEEVSLDPWSKLGVLAMDCCRSLKSVSGLPPNPMTLDASGCTSLEKVSFAGQNLHSFVDEGNLSMTFCACFCLNEESIDNIEANAMLKIQSLAEKWIHLNPYYYGIKVICEYQLAAASGNEGGGRFEKFKTEFYVDDGGCNGDHVWILCGKDMVREDNNYEEASFDFQIHHSRYRNIIKVKKCGVKAFYVDAESNTITDANIEEARHHSATETRSKRSRGQSV